MRSSTRLDSAVFQLTPTRTRCDLIISANGKTEKIASGLVNPFVAHLKIAQDQMAKGGYSIVLEPEPENEATWFTRGTVERFVRFVSTPEVLERVYTLESEILQIEEAIAMQSNNDIGLNSVGEAKAKSAKHTEGLKPLPDSNDEKAIVLYEPGAHPPVANESTAEEGNSRVQLMKVLETRRSVLQKEQGMAFARSVAAGFDMDHMASLMSFSESFGAQRLKDACVRFKDLWKRKHETGQWLEIEASEAMTGRADYSVMNASGIVLASPVAADPSAGSAMDQQTPSGQPEYHQGQFPHPMLPPWPIHSPPGTVPVFQGYTMQGVPYYQNYPGNGPFYHPQYPSGDDPRVDSEQRTRRRRHSMDTGDNHAEAETWDLESSKTRSQDDADVEHKPSGSYEASRRGSRSGKKKSGMVVIRNLNYITSKSEDLSGSDLESASGSEDGEKTRLEAKLKSSKKGKRSNLETMDEVNAVSGKNAGGAQWDAFQTYLLKDADEAEHADKSAMFALEKDVRGKRRPNASGNDPLSYEEREVAYAQGPDANGVQEMSGKWSDRRRTSSDATLVSGRTGHSADGSGLVGGQVDLQSSEVNGVKGRYRRESDDFIMHGPQTRSHLASSDPLAVNKFERDFNRDFNRNSSHNMDDDSYVVSLRSNSLDQARTDGRNAIDIDSEFTSSVPRLGELSTLARSQSNYEPDALSLMPERGMKNETAGYDPALEYGAAQGKTKMVAEAGQGSKKLDKERKSKLTPDSADKKKNGGPIRKGKTSKLSPLEEARARAEKLRNYKADLQKMKREKEQEQIKRLEALKLERQKRIAARSGPVSSQSTTQQNRKSLPVKLSPNSHKGSKFSDTAPGSSSPLQRSSIRAVPTGSSDSIKAPGKMSAGSRLSSSVSSLPESKKENGDATLETKVPKASVRRLSEPKMGASPVVSSARTQKAGVAPKTKVSNVPDSTKISAILNHDKHKAASLPELKTRTTKAVAANAKPFTEEIPLKINNSNPTPTSHVPELNSDATGASHQPIDGDDNAIVEKTVLMLEHEKPSVSVANGEAGIVASSNKWHASGSKIVENLGISVEYSANPPRVIPFSMNEVGIKPVEVKPHNTSNNMKEIPISSGEKQYVAPFARVSSMEDPSTRNSEYGKAPPTSLHTVATGADTLKVLVPNPRSIMLEKIPESVEKPKESPKGFRKLLKLGKKSHSEADNNSRNGSETDDTAVNTSEAHTLKHLIYQDETPTASGTPPKSSRHFSLLSPFRSKTSGKKQTP